MYSNDSYIAEEFYNRAYDRQEDAGDCTCPECKGKTETEYCINCGLHHEECECDTPDLIIDTCEKCFGTGEV